MGSGATGPSQASSAWGTETAMWTRTKLNIWLTKLQASLSPSKGTCATQWAQMETQSQLLCLASYWLEHNPNKVLYNKLPNKLPFGISAHPQPSGASCPHPLLSWRETVLSTASGCKPAAPGLLSSATEATVETEPCLAEAEVAWVVVYTTHTCALTHACGDREQPQVSFLKHQPTELSPQPGPFSLFLIFICLLLFSGGAWCAYGGQRTTCGSQFLPPCGSQGI